jgi:DNA-binding transcriptional MerR regulator
VARQGQRTYRQLDYWARTGQVAPSLRGASGSGSQRLYSFRDVVTLSIVKRLLGTGVSLANVRTALATLRTHHTGDLAGLTLIADGVGVYLTGDDEQIIDLVKGGQAVFGLALGQVHAAMHATLTHLPAETPDAAEPGPRPALRVVS